MDIMHRLQQSTGSGTCISDNTCKGTCISIGIGIGAGAHDVHYFLTTDRLV